MIVQARAGIVKENRVVKQTAKAMRVVRVASSRYLHRDIMLYHLFLAEIFQVGVRIEGA